MSKQLTSLQKNAERFATRKGRKVVVDGQLWKFSVGGKGLSVVAYSEAGERRCAPAHEILRITRGELLEKRVPRYEDEFGVSIATSDIVGWLRRSGNE